MSTADMSGHLGLVSSSQTKGTNSTSFLTHVRKERSGVSTLGLRKWAGLGDFTIGK